MKKLMKRTALPALIIALTASPVLCGNILIPGYETLHFKAGQVTQDVSFRNPEENICSFRMSLTLEDGTPVWIADDLIFCGDDFCCDSWGCSCIFCLIADKAHTHNPGASALIYSKP